MPFSRPTLTQIRARVASEIAAAFPGSDPLLRNSNLLILGTTLSGLTSEQYGYLDWIAKNAVPFTCTSEFLEAWAGLKNVTRKAAVAATGAITITGNAGIVVPSGTPLARGDAVQFVTTASATIGGGGTIAVNAAAVVAGAAGNTALNSILTLGTAISGVQSNTTVTTAFTGGADTETDDSLRTRMLQAYQNPPQGGDAGDYVTWALSVAGVTRAWCTPLWAGAGTVAVYVMLDVTQSSHGGFPQGTDGVATSETRDTPATGDQLTVANVIYPLRPVTALVYVKAPVATPVNFTINGISTATAATKTAIAAAIADVFLRLDSPGGTIDLSDIESAIAAIPASEGFVITSPSANITKTAGQLSTVGTITYT